MLGLTITKIRTLNTVQKKLARYGAPLVLLDFHRVTQFSVLLLQRFIGFFLEVVVRRLSETMKPSHSLGGDMQSNETNSINAP